MTAAAGNVYAVAGRLAGIDTNLRAFESYSPVTKRWTKLAPVPDPRGGTGAAFAKGLIVSVGGEEPQGTIGSVFRLQPDDEALAPSRRPADAAPRRSVSQQSRGRVYVIGGGTEPGLTVSGANESLTLP